MIVASRSAGLLLAPAAVSAASVAGFLYLIFIGSLVGFTAYIWLLQVAPPARVATYAYVNPVIAVLLGAVVAGERFSALQLVGGAVVLLAVVVVIAAERRRGQGVSDGSMPCER